MGDYWYTDGMGRKRHVVEDCKDEFRGSNTYSNTNRKRLNSYQDMTKKTSCSRCGDDVYFIRHNGGGVYVDDLGWPWPKHECFKDLPIWYNHFYQTSKESNESLTGVIQEVSSKIGILLLSIDFENIGKAKVEIEKTLLPDSIIGLITLINFKKKEVTFLTDFGIKRMVSLDFKFSDTEEEKLYPYIINFNDRPLNENTIN
jgi:hypothetical protein